MPKPRQRRFVGQQSLLQLYIDVSSAALAV
jgi:hypothetical protein